MAVILAVVGALLTAIGAGMWSVPAGLLVAGGECLAAAYMVAYMKARTVA